MRYRIETAYALRVTAELSSQPFYIPLTQFERAFMYLSLDQITFFCFCLTKMNTLFYVYGNVILLGTAKLS